MRYIGSKQNVIQFLDRVFRIYIDSYKNKTIADIFSGTTVVSRYFKIMGSKVISNDYLAFSYTLQKAWIANNKTPEFNKLKNFGLRDYNRIIEYLNNLTGEEDFFYRNYSPEGSGIFSKHARNYFSDKNAKKIDAILKILRYWKDNKYITDIEDSVLRTSLIEAVTKVSNISGTYGAFLKKDDKRKFKPLFLKPINFINSKFKNESYNDDALNLITKIQGDYLYLDPPYNSRQYPPYYHILDTLSLDDYPKIYGKTGRRPYSDQLSPFCIKNKALEAILKLIKDADFKFIFLSYNTDGLVPINTLKEKLKKLGKIDFYSQFHKRYKSNNGNTIKNGLKEILFYVEK